MSIMGTRVVRNEDPVFLSRGAMYTDDLTDERLTGALHLTLVRSPLAHARITSIDVEEARSAPGVVAVFTAADIDLEPPLLFPMAEKGMARPWLATEKVRFVGEPVVAVLTERRYQGQDAAELVVVDYDPLPAVVDLRAAASDEVLVFPDVGTNTIDGSGWTRSSTSTCSTTARSWSRGRSSTSGVAACPLEVRAAAAVWGDDGRLTLWCSHPERAGRPGRASPAGSGSTPTQVRVVAPDVGGGFGAKIGADPEALLVGWLAGTLGRPVRWVETRTENMIGHGARPGPAADDHDRRQPRRRRRSPTGSTSLAGRRRLPAASARCCRMLPG